MIANMAVTQTALAIHLASYLYIVNYPATISYVATLWKHRKAL